MAVLREIHALARLPVPLPEIPPETWRDSLRYAQQDPVTGKWKRASGHFVVRLEFSEASLRVQHQGALGQWIGRAVKAAREKGGPRSTSPEEVERKRKRAGADLGTSSSGRGGGKGTGKTGGKGKSRGNKGGGARGRGVAGRREEKEK